MHHLCPRRCSKVHQKSRTVAEEERGIYGWSSQASDKGIDIDEWDKISEGTVTLEQIQAMESAAKEQHEIYLQQLKYMADQIKSKTQED